MTSLQPYPIIGSKSGLTTNKKPYLLVDDAFPELLNGYVYQEQVIERQGVELIGRLRRVLTALAQSNTTGAGTYTDTDLLGSVRGTEPNAAIEPGSVVFRIDPGGGNETIYTDPLSNGVLVWQSGPYTITGGSVNYSTGALNLIFSVAPGVLTTNSDLNYYPALPVMGIPEREQAGINDEQTIFFDTKYAYIWNGVAFVEFITGTTWAGTDADFFWSTNYRGTAASTRLFFTTNFVSSAANPIRYTDAVTWTAFAPLITATDTLYQARIIIPYYGRLLFLNTYEGTTAGGYAGAVNFFNRCRFSQIGDPIAADAYRVDIIGKGGSLDAPTNEEIVSASFIKNTLIVEFEQTTWQLRYVGEYGLPFIWERISADLGSESTFSAVVFDQGVLAVGDKAIISADASGVNRIDLDIPKQIFDFRNADNGVKRVQGIRDFQRELVFWCYSDAQLQRKFPNKVLVYNYRNNTYARFRDNVTAFGSFQSNNAITWDRTDIYWDDETVLWDDTDNQTLFPFVVSGNQQGFIHKYGYVTPDEPSLSITAIDITVTPIQITSPNHNLETGETVYLTGLNFVNSITLATVSTSLNNTIYQVKRINDNIFSISKWNFTTQQYDNNFTFTPAPGTSTYVGGGQITLFPKPYIQTKDFNPYLAKGGQMTLSYIDFLMSATPSSAMTVLLYANTSPAVQGNLIVGNVNVTTSLTAPFYSPDSDIAWQRFYATLSAQFIRIVITYDDNLMNTLSTHQQKLVLNSIILWSRPGGRNPF